MAPFYQAICWIARPDPAFRWKQPETAGREWAFPAVASSQQIPEEQ